MDVVQTAVASMIRTGSMDTRSFSLYCVDLSM